MRLLFHPKETTDIGQGRTCDDTSRDPASYLLRPLRAASSAMVDIPQPLLFPLPTFLDVMNRGGREASSSSNDISVISVVLRQCSVWSIELVPIKKVGMLNRKSSHEVVQEICRFQTATIHLESLNSGERNWNHINGNQILFSSICWMILSMATNFQKVRSKFTICSVNEENEP